MTVELLRFRVPPGRATEFVDRNEEVWTPALREQEGFLRRTILRSSDHSDVLMIAVCWRDRSDMEAFPDATQRRLEREMQDLVLEQEQWIYELVLSDESPGAD
jgi:uncharacterized protein (TIGR03792 family)